MVIIEPKNHYMSKYIRELFSPQKKHLLAKFETTNCLISHVSLPLLEQSFYISLVNTFTSPLFLWEVTKFACLYAMMVKLESTWDNASFWIQSN